MSKKQYIVLAKKTTQMTRDEIIDYLNIEEPVLFLDPPEVYDKGILGISEDHCHLIYGYWALVTALAEDYEKEWVKNGSEGEKPDFYNDAMEWIDYNTIRSLPYYSNENCPIVIYELPGGEK